MYKEIIINGEKFYYTIYDRTTLTKQTHFWHESKTKLIKEWVFWGKLVRVTKGGSDFAIFGSIEDPNIWKEKLKSEIESAYFGWRRKIARMEEIKQGKLI